MLYYAARLVQMFSIGFFSSSGWFYHTGLQMKHLRGLHPLICAVNLLNWAIFRFAMLGSSNDSGLSGRTFELGFSVFCPLIRKENLHILSPSVHFGVKLKIKSR